MGAAAQPAAGKPAGLRFKPHFAVKTLDTGGIALLSDGESYVLSGLEYTALEPLLDGSHDADALVDRLSEAFAPERIYYALSRLQKRGLLSESGDQQPSVGADEESHIELRKQPSPPHVHVYTALVHQSLDSRLKSHVILPPITVSGWDETDTEARARCLAEAAERTAGLNAGTATVKRARLADLSGRAISPDELMLFSDRQYRDNDHEGASDPRILKPYEPDVEIDWVAARSITKDQEVWLPSAYCYYAARHADDQAYSLADSSGCAAGRTLDDAIVRGFLELVERDAVAIWWYNRVRRPLFDISSAHDPFFAATQDALHERGRTLFVFDLTHDLGIPVAAAVSWRRSDLSGLRIGLGAGFENHSALRQSIGELNQLVFANREAVSDPEIPEFLRQAADEEYAVIQAHADQPAQLSDTTVSVSYCADLLRRHGLELIALDQTLPDVQMHVARVVVPALRHTGTRFAPGRLYDVPVTLGWRERPATEVEFHHAPSFRTSESEP